MIAGKSITKNGFKVGRPCMERTFVVQPSDPSIRYIPLTYGRYAIVSAHRYEHLMQWEWRA